MSGLASQQDGGQFEDAPTFSPKISSQLLRRENACATDAQPLLPSPDHALDVRSAPLAAALLAAREAEGLVWRERLTALAFLRALWAVSARRARATFATPAADLRVLRPLLGARGDGAGGLFFAVA